MGCCTTSSAASLFSGKDGLQSKHMQMKRNLHEFQVEKVGGAIVP